jgi:hypothetical protein
MTHFIVRKDNLYQYPRRNTGKMYVNRTTHGPDIGQARVFNTKNAARNSSRGWGEVIEIELKVKDEPATS